MAEDVFGFSAAKHQSRVDRNAVKTGLESFLKEHPHFFVYIRRDLRYPHSECYISSNKEPNPDCPVCFGLGYKISFEKHMCRRSLPGRLTSGQGTLAEQEEMGLVSAYKEILYSPKCTYPSKYDLYIEVEWDTTIDKIPTIGRPVNVIRTYRVDVALSLSEDTMSYFVSGLLPYELYFNQQQQWLLFNNKSWVYRGL
jgi:hypothetical protein